MCVKVKYVSEVINFLDRAPFTLFIKLRNVPVKDLDEILKYLSSDFDIAIIGIRYKEVKY